MGQKTGKMGPIKIFAISLLALLAGEYTTDSVPWVDIYLVITQFGHMHSSWQGFLFGVSALSDLNFFVSLKEDVALLYENDNWIKGAENCIVSCQKKLRVIRYLNKCNLWKFCIFNFVFKK